MRFAYCLLFAILLTSSLTASASGFGNASPESGVWTGTIGDSKVMACFMRDDDPPRANRSAYFYLRHSKLISLIPDPDKKTLWFESNVKTPTGIWNINVQHDRITGHWSNSVTGKTLVILLKRFRSFSSEHSPSCDPETDLFDPVVYPQVLSEKVAFGEEQTFNSRRYRVLSALEGAVKSVELIGESKTMAVLNTLLSNELKVGISAYYGCPTNGEGYSGKSGKNEKPDYDSSTAPVFWNDQWISFVSRSSGNCGGAYPFSGFSYINWNLTTGQIANLWEWIKNSKKKDGFPQHDPYYFNYSAPESLNVIIAKKAIKQRLAFNPKEASEENNCLDVIKDNKEYMIHLSKNGMIFSQAFPHVTQACGDDIEIPYGQLMPFLTKKGRDAVSEIQSGS